MKNNITELMFILDRNGSMAGLEGDAIGGFNAMIEKQKRQKRRHTTGSGETEPSITMRTERAPGFCMIRGPRRYVMSALPKNKK